MIITCRLSLLMLLLLAVSAFPHSRLYRVKQIDLVLSGTVVTPEGVLELGYVLIIDGRISAVSETTAKCTSREHRSY